MSRPKKETPAPQPTYVIQNCVFNGGPEAEVRLALAKAIEANANAALALAKKLDNAAIVINSPQEPKV